jgi:uncharacterized OsmC-like protein
MYVLLLLSELEPGPAGVAKETSTAISKSVEKMCTIMRSLKTTITTTLQ